MEPILKLLAEAKFNGLKDIQHGQLEDFLILNGGAVTSPRGKIHLCACFTLNGINLSSGVSALTHDRLSIQIRISYISQEALQRCLQSVCKPVAPGRKVGVGQIEKKCDYSAIRWEFTVPTRAWAEHVFPRSETTVKHITACSSHTDLLRLPEVWMFVFLSFTMDLTLYQFLIWIHTINLFSM